MGMFGVVTRPRTGDRKCAVSFALVATTVALSVVLAGCTASEREASHERADGTTVESVTTSWTPPADPTAKGPTNAPALPEESGPLDEPIVLATGMAVTVGPITATTIKPQTPGEVAGSAVIVTVSLKNTSDAAQNADSAVVMLEAADGGVGIATTAGPNKALRGDIEPGARIEGSYVFMLDPAKGREVTVSVNYAAGEPLALFTGTVS